MLLDKYEKIQDVEASALAAAAKAGRPKPPPRPKKPEFLSSARHDGHVPIAGSSSVLKSSSSTLETSLSAFQISTSQSEQSSLLYSNPNQMAGLQVSMVSMSMTAPGSMVPSAPPATSLASYKPLQPTIYKTSSSPSASSPVFQPIITSSVGGMINSGPQASTSPAPTSMAAVPIIPGPRLPLQPLSNPISAPRLAYNMIPPASVPAVIANGKGEGVKKASEQLPAVSSNVQIITSRGNGASDDSYKYPLSIKPQRLLEYMKQPDGASLLLIDVRMQVQYAHARIKTPSIVNIEPPALRDGVSAKTIADQGLFNNPPSERKLFADRASFSLVIYYDQNSTEIPTSGPLCNLFRALHDLEFEKPLFRRPVFLIGGFDAWLECTGMKWVQGEGVGGTGRVGPSTPPSSDASNKASATSMDNFEHRPGLSAIPYDYSSHNSAIFAKLSRGGGINRRDGNIIRRNLDDYLKRDDGPQSMVNARIGSNVPNMAYPPRATPYTNINASSYPHAHLTYNTAPPSSASAISDGAYGGHPPDLRQSQLEGVTPTPRAYRSDAGKLQRRQTIYDDHWNNFGATDRSQVQHATSPPVPAKIPISDTSMSIGLSEAPMSSGPTLPSIMPSTSSIRPLIPSKPMRPLPQPPGMNDLKDYTKFGSGFSKIGGSQLGKTGLTNLGNTCFMNSVIQCLIATPPLSRYFLDGSFKRHINVKNPLGTQGKLADAFSDLIRNMWSGQSLVVSPTSFRYAIGGFAPQFKGTEQHDSQEFLSFLLDGLHEDLKLEPRPPPPGDDEGSEADEARMESLPEYEASEIAWQRYLRRDNSIVVNLFQGQFMNRLQCTKCGKTSTTYNAFMYLALPIMAKTSGRQSQTLLSCLNAFVEPEIMEGDNAWNCPKCQKPRKATKQLTISRVPDVLLIQLKRFSSDGPFKNKIKAMVQYPIQDLDLTKYLPKRTSTGTAEPAVYDLYAVSNHSGEVSSGHYTACVRGESPNSWINFDDSRVSPCDKSVAVSEHGYTLFYVRRK
ncbi:hypothetical protein BC939DRAFT_16908 [Gamsiella multidivaricata]|uniref:uncharacterized protein n=1 Tax=Gamsiella multidivaricata TaxID=101098 RepID=UPI00222013C0|nr:uncharacterized protein BC939DRAFT_16908 [Gamsiella multidivaricata]KAI7817153.1 hypothetical protein BC939DRAFT_16908 [Gamsiella multidivaricata]